MDRVTVKNLQAEVNELRLRLEEAECTLEAIRTGQVDSIVVDGRDGLRIFSLEGANHSYRILVEAMNEGAATFTEDGTILYCNARFARMLEAPLHEVMGASIQGSLPGHAKSLFAGLLRQAADGESRGEVVLQTRTGKELAAHLSVSALKDAGRMVFCLVATDLTQQKQELDKILSSMSESLLVFDAESRVVKTNAAATRVLGFDPVGFELAELTSRIMLTSPDDRNLVPQELPAARALRGETITNLRLTLSPQGRRLTFSVSSSPLQHGERITGAVSVWHDITEFERSQAALRESEARLSSVLEHSLDCIYRYNIQEHSFDYISPASQRILGFSPEELKTQAAEETLSMVHPEDREAVRAALVRLEDAGEAKAEYRQQTKDGGYCWVSNHMSLIRDDAGRPRYRNSSIRDVTDRKRSEEALREANAQLRLVQDAASAGAWDWCIASRELFWSDQCKALYGLSADAEVTFERFLAAVHPDDRCLVEEGIRRALAHREPYDVEMRVQWPDGSIHWTRSLGRAYFDSSGKASRMAGLVLDISSVKEAQKALRESESRYRALFENLPDAAFLTMADGTILAANPAAQKMFQMTEKEITLAGREGLVDTTDPTYWAALEERERTGRYAHRPMVHIRKGGERFVTEVSSVVLPDGPLSAFVIIRDVTERKQAEEALKKANEQLLDMDRRKNEFLAVLSHELRNPLAPIRNSVYIIGRSAPGGEQARRAQTVIDRQVAHMTRLIDDLLDVTRISRGKIRLQRESLDLNEIVRGTGEDMREVFRRNGIELETAVTGKSLRIFGDRIRIAQIIGNLLQNAAKFTPRGGRTTLSLEAKGDEAEIRVSDTGVGLEPGLVDKLFQPFMQADQTLDRSVGGLGLGLALVKGLVEHHGGRVSAASAGRARARASRSVCHLSRRSGRARQWT